MSSDAEIERLIANWLTESAPKRAPDRILTSTAQQIDTGPGGLGSRIGRRIRRVRLQRVAGIAGMAAVVAIVVGLAVRGLVAGPTGGPGGIGSSAPSLSPSPNSSPNSSPSPSMVASGSPAAGARLDDLCSLLSVDEVEGATGTRWQLEARPGRYLDGDPKCQYLATGDAPVGVQGEPLNVVIIEQLIAPVMVSHWNDLHGVDVPVDGATARWVKGQDALVVAKGDVIVTVEFQTEQSQIPGSGTPPPAGLFEAAARQLVQKVADRLP